MTSVLARVSRRAAIAAIVLAGSASGSEAASVTTDAFLAVARPTIALLVQSSMLAESRAEPVHLRLFAKREAIHQAEVGRSIDAWRQAEERRTATNPFESSLDRLTSTGQALTIPFAALADATNPASPPLTRLPSPDALAARDDAALALLSSRTGEAFDATYATIQVAALERLTRVYKSFVLDGDDRTLRAIAVHDLPVVEQALAKMRARSSALDTRR